MGNAQELVRAHLRASAETKLRAAESCAPEIVRAAEAIATAIAAGGKILLCGNGGSAADCQHMAAEFVSRLSADFVRPGIPAIAPGEVITRELLAGLREAARDGTRIAYCADPSLATLQVVARRAGP